MRQVLKGEYIHSMTSVCTVAVVEDHPSLNRTMGILLEHAGHRVRSFTSGEALLEEEAFLSQCDCVLLDIQLPGMSGLDVLNLLHDRDGAPAAVVLTGTGDVPIAVEAMRLGAVDFIQKPCLPTVLLAAVEKARREAERRRTSCAPGRDAAERLGQLSHRQRQVLAGMVEGQPSKIIAHNLNLSHRTVEAYRAQMLAKLGARSTADAVRVALSAPEAMNGDA
jgi:two-component system, LuxR family, response regulator FixJ